MDLGLIPLALCPVGFYSGFAANGLALIPVALFNSCGPKSGWPLFRLAPSPVHYIYCIGPYSVGP
jgi:hypothetical protein